MLIKLDNLPSFPRAEQVARGGLISFSAFLVVLLVFLEWFFEGRYSWTRLRCLQFLFNSCRLAAIVSLRLLDVPPEDYPPGHISFTSSLLVSLNGYCFALVVFSPPTRQRIASYLGNQTVTIHLDSLDLARKVDPLPIKREPSRRPVRLGSTPNLFDALMILFSPLPRA